MIYALVFILLFAMMLVYFRVADHFNIIDHPNERSSHSEVTIRGGGVIFLFAAIAVVIMYPGYWLPVTGILVIGIVSFIDDRISLSSRLRLLVHLLAVTIMFWFLNIFHAHPVWMTVFLYIVAIGVINMYNFMDGINGITGAYSLIALGGLQYVNLYQAPFIEKDMIWLPIIGCLVFLFFNFRKKAKCFAGDVGSVTIAFWIIFLIFSAILKTGNWAYLLFLSVYGIDSVLTIAHRAILRQNIFKAHRFHFYQVLANEQKIPHLYVAVGYALLQAIITGLIIVNTTFSPLVLFCLIVMPLATLYIILKPILIKGK